MVKFILGQVLRYKALYLRNLVQSNRGLTSNKLQRNFFHRFSIECDPIGHTLEIPIIHSVEHVKIKRFKNIWSFCHRIPKSAELTLSNYKSCNCDFSF